jgi:hypothetical protein
MIHHWGSLPSFLRKLDIHLNTNTKSTILCSKDVFAATEPDFFAVTELNIFAYLRKLDSRADKHGLSFFPRIPLDAMDAMDAMGGMDAIKAVLD